MELVMWVALAAVGYTAMLVLTARFSVWVVSRGGMITDYDRGMGMLCGFLWPMAFPFFVVVLVFDRGPLNSALGFLARRIVP